MSLENFPKQLSDVVQYEVEQNFTRVEGEAAAALEIGQVVSKDSNGKIIKVVVTTPADVVGVVVSQSVASGETVAYVGSGPAILRKDALDYNGSTAAQATAIDAQLAKLNIKLR